MSEDQAPASKTTVDHKVLTSIGTIADVAAIAALLISGLLPIATVASLLAVLLGAVLFIRNWGKVVNVRVAMSVAVMLAGAVAFTIAVSRFGPATDPSTIQTSTSASSTSFPPPSANGYVLAEKDFPLSLERVKYCRGQQIDLDTPRVGATVDSADVEYWLCEPDPAEFRSASEASAFAKVTSEISTPTQCVSLANQQRSGPVLIDTFEEGKTAFCILTYKQAVAWLRYTGTRDNKLMFELTLWRKK